jgi:hypothetical protein
MPSEDVVAALARNLDPFIAAQASGRYFGFVNGGVHPAAYGAELLVSTWDQNAVLYSAAPHPCRTVADQLAASGRAEVMNEVVLNQVLARWLADAGDHDRLTDHVISRIQADGTAYFGGTTWNGMRLMRISVADWSTDEDDVDRAVKALLRCAG